MRLNFLDELDQLKSSCRKQKVKHHEDPLLSKLTAHHNRLSAQADNILTEHSAKVVEVVNDLAQIDDVSRPIAGQSTR